MLDKFYTIDELAELLKVSRKTIVRYVQSGKIKSYKFKREYRISQEQFTEFLDNNLVKVS